MNERTQTIVIVHDRAQSRAIIEGWLREEGAMTDHTCTGENCITCEVADRLEEIIQACTERMEAAIDRAQQQFREGVFDGNEN